jgi:V/A-type H+-transporting ATPase subunit A
MLDMIENICRIDFTFGYFEEVSAFFRKLINICKQMNYSVFESDDFNTYKKQLNQAIEEQPKTAVL